jgi:hypothetical protein
VEFPRELAHGTRMSRSEEQGAGDLEGDFASEEIDRAGDVGCCRNCGIDEYARAGKMQVTSEIEPAPALFSEHFAGGRHDPIGDEQVNWGGLMTYVGMLTKLACQ